MTQLDTALPEYEVSMAEDRIVHAPPSHVFATFENLKISDMRMARFLAVVRNFGRPNASSKEGPLLAEEVRRFGWVTLLRDPPRELIVGLLGQVWRRDFGVAKVADRDAFVRFQKPGHAEIVVSYRFDRIVEGTRVVSETRVHCTDEHAARRFRW